MRSHQHFQQKVTASLNTMEAKICYLHDGVKGLKEALREFQTEITDFMVFTADNHVDHENRIRALEKKIKS